MAVIRMRSLPVALAVALSSCALMPPGMREAREHGVPHEAAAPVASAPASAPGAQAKAADANAIDAAPKLHQGTGIFVRPPLAKPPVAGPEEASLNFEALDVREVAKVILGDYLKQSYTVHPNVQGTVTFRTVKPIAMRDLLPTLEMLLRQNGAAVVQEDNIYKILPVSAVRGSVSPQLGLTNAPIPAGFSVLVVPLAYVGANEMVKILEPFASDNTVRADPVRNLVILAGNQRELTHLMDTVQMFDVDWLAGYSVGVFPMKSVDVKTLMTDLERVFGAQGQGNPLAGIVRMIPIERMNAVVIVTTQPRYLELAKSWLDKIDIAGTSGGGTRFFVYQVRNGKAENLAQLVGDLFSARRTTTTAPSLAPGSRPAQISSTPFGQPTPPGQTTTTTVTPPAGATFQIPGSVTGTTANEVRVIADKDTNSLLILATPGDYEVIASALKQLDVTRRQVLVEVLLAEVTLTDDLQYGIDWFIRSSSNRSFVGSQNFGGSLQPGNGNGAPLVPSTIQPGTLPPANFAGLQLINLAGSEVRAVLRALGTDGKTKVLASPQIMVLDNEKAEIKVGDRISVQTAQQTGVSTGTGVVNSYSYLETGILLAVTPRINSGGMVTLEINQEVSAPVANTATAANPNPNVSTRNAKTSVVVGNGESIVLGGLIRENMTFSGGGIPLLSKIPVLGALFGSQDFHRDRTELVLLITPKIVSDPAQAREATDELRLRLPTLEKMLPVRKAEPAPPPSPETQQK
jgi:general secretion pathway protein D